MFATCPDLIDRINPFDAAYAVLAKAMDEKSLRQVQATIAAKKVSIPEDEARELAKRALQFKNERGRCQTSTPPMHGKSAWLKGVAALARITAHRPRQHRERQVMSEMNDDELLDALGVEVAPLKVSSRTPREEPHHRRLRGHSALLSDPRPCPQHGEDRNIFERLYAVRPGQRYAGCRKRKPCWLNWTAPACSRVRLPLRSMLMTCGRRCLVGGAGN